MLSMHMTRDRRKDREEKVHYNAIKGKNGSLKNVALLHAKYWLFLSKPATVLKNQPEPVSDRILHQSN